ncbi:twin-arginine translocation pathway signal [Actibacterium mucosum KCTC 23349]|uniref:Twin-arginine translocation pathway signal n=1 Tax=Actibacterium mucosum KCTC 23349 TaxID=1454373 RepID=A0A037ZPN2_9RHOB|nr:YSC84-related protein [Actibacterium mucosum]KAJ56791.1 twin-arginine translocation pathway signal [Actibacterium mucosum KCTC 23349]
MSSITRRGFLSAAGTTTLLSACGNGIGSNGAAEVDARVDSSRQYLLNNVAGTAELEQKAQGVLWMPLVTEAGFLVGASYGEGALRIGGATVDYYSAAQASFGLQVGAQQYAHALFFLTPGALNSFRTSEGLSFGADLKYATPDQGGSIGAETLTALDPVVAVVFGQAGLLVGASLEGTAYNRIIP